MEGRCTYNDNCDNEALANTGFCAEHLCSAPACDNPVWDEGFYFCGNHSARCRLCDTVVSDDTIVEYYDDYGSPWLLCESCESVNTYMCDYCRETFASTNGEPYEDIDGDNVCRACRNEYFVWCSDCQEYHHYENAEDCRVIQSYGFEPCYTFHGKGPMFLGVELEVECSHDPQEDARDLLAQVCFGIPMYLKHDGSLNNGFEIATDPIDFPTWKSFEPKVRQLFKWAKDSGIRSYDTDTCGMHIHVDRAAFRSSLHLYKVMKIVYENPGFTLLVSRRDATNLDRWASLMTDMSIDEVLHKLARKAKTNQNERYSRYVAVNLEPDATVEFRLFRGTLSVSGFYRNLEYVASVIEFTKDTAIADCTVANYLAFVQANRREYPALYQFFVDKFPSFPYKPTEVAQQCV